MVVAPSARSSLARAAKKLLIRPRSAVLSVNPPSPSTNSRRTPRRADQPMRQGVEDVLGRRLPEELHLAPPDRRFEVEAEPLGLAEQPRRAFEEAEQEPWLGLAGASDELQAKRGLARPRKTDQRRRAGGGDAAVEHRVELLDPGREPRLPCLVGPCRLRVKRLEPRVHDQAGLGDPERMAAAQETAAAELAHLEPAFGTEAVELVAELDDAVHHGVLGGDLFARGRAGEQQGGAAGERDLRLQLVDELLELGARDRLVLGRDQAVEDQHGDAAGLNLAPQQRQQALEPLVLQHAEGAEVDDRVRHQRGVEEPQAFEVQQHAGVHLGQQRDVEAPPAATGMVVGDLVAEDGLAGARGALDDVGAGAEQAAAEDGIQAVDAAGHPLQATAGLGHGADTFSAARPSGSAAGPSGSTTADLEPAAGAPSIATVPPSCDRSSPTGQSSAFGSAAAGSTRTAGP